MQEDADDVAEEQCGGRVREDTEAELDHEAGEEDTDSNYDRMEEVDCEEMLLLHCAADNKIMSLEIIQRLLCTFNNYVVIKC